MGCQLLNLPIRARGGCAAGKIKFADQGGGISPWWTDWPNFIYVIMVYFFYKIVIQMVWNGYSVFTKT